MSKSKFRIAITGGGTAGHVYPALAVASELRKRGAEILYVGSKQGPEATLVPAASLPFRKISTGKLRRYLDYRNFLDPFKSGIGVFQAQRILRKYGANAVFTKGGYVSVPVLFAAKTLGIPIVAHESDTVAGLANRLAARLANRVCTGFPASYYPGIPQEKIVFTGNPVRSRFKSVRGKKFHKLFNLQPKVPTILITGGSQGAHNLNVLTSKITSDLLKVAQVIHQTGEGDFGRFSEIKNSRYRVFPYLDKLPEAIATADIVVTRAGANALAEIAYLGKPAIIVPLSTAAGDHQTKNAEYYRKAKAATLVDERTASSSDLLIAIKTLLKNSDQRRWFSENIKALATPDAANKIAEEVMRACLPVGRAAR